MRSLDSARGHDLESGIVDIPGSIEEITRIKQEKGLSIAIVLPTLNEERTIGRILDTWRPLIDIGLIDDIKVVDSGSRDHTEREVSRRQVPFISAEDELRELGFPKVGGKGENMWVGQMVTDADVLVYADSDMENPRTETVVNLLSPIVKRDQVKLVKSIFRRDSHNTVADNLAGGRVTRLAAKPIMQILFPELNNVLQPLNGNIAVRRSAIEEIPLGRKYEADLDILVQIALRYGPQSIGQVNCGSFEQEGQTIEALEKMAHQCVRLLFEIARDTGRISLPGDLPNYFIQHLVTQEGLKEEQFAYGGEKLPAAVQIQDYIKRRLTDLLFLRHAPTEYNLQNRFQGQVQTPVNLDALPEYLRQAGIERIPKPDLIVCSSLVRTRQTAEAIMAARGWSGIPVIVEENLDERNWGDLQGKTRQEAKSTYPEIDDLVDSFGFAPEGGETLEKVRGRAHLALKRIKSLYSGKKILCITHQGVMLSLGLKPGDHVTVKNTGGIEKLSNHSASTVHVQTLESRAASPMTI